MQRDRCRQYGHIFAVLSDTRWIHLRGEESGRLHDFPRLEPMRSSAGKLLPTATANVLLYRMPRRGTSPIILWYGSQ